MKLTNHVYLVGSGHFGLSHAFGCSVFLVDCGDEIVMIDAGAGCEPEWIVRNMKNVGCKIFLGEPEADMVEKGDEKDLSLDIAKKSGFYSPDYTFNNCQIDVRLGHEANISCGNYAFQALNVPGHSPGSICFLIDLPEGRALFSGDAVFPEGVNGRYRAVLRKAG